MRLPIRTIAGVRLKRRDLLRLAQVVGVGSAAGTISLVGRDGAAVTTASGTCRICTMHCGIVATRKGRRLLRVEGDPNSATRGFLCLQGQALPEIVHAPQRVRRPLKRAGSRFVEIGWDQALAEIASKLLDVKREFGARAVAMQTGWPFVRHPFIRVLQRLCAALGTPNLATVASLCESSSRMGRALVLGSKSWPDLARTRTLVVWGANPTHSSPPFAHQVAAKSRGNGRLFVIDPTRTELADHATEFLQIRPGTDGALALGLLHVIVAEGLYDSEVASSTVGFDALADLVRRYDPERTASITGIRAEQILRVARDFATHGPSAVWEGLGVEHHENGVQTVRAIAMLEALCGYVDKPGGAKLDEHPGPRFYEEILPSLPRMTTPEPVPPPLRDPPIGREEFPLYEIFTRKAQGNLFARAAAEDRPYPLRALLLFGSNSFITAPGSAHWREALKNLRLIVSVDPFLTASGELADYVLPASTFAEAPDVDPEDRVARSGLAPQQFESWPDWRIAFELGRALGLGQYFPWSTFQEFTTANQVPYLDDPACTLKPRPPIDGEPAPRFGTPSGRIELSSETLACFGLDPLPSWKAPSARPDESYPLILVSGPRTRPYVNSQFRQIPSVASKMPEPGLELHPSAARSAGVGEGDWAAVVSPSGRIVLRVRINQRVRPDVAVIPHGWARANANELTDDAHLDPISGFPVFRSGVCRVEAIGRYQRPMDVTKT